MAAIGKIRSWGPVLVCVIGFALFAFIAEELFRSWQSTRTDQHQQVGEILGEKINVMDFQKLVDEYQEVMKMQGQTNLNDDQMNQIKDQVWQSFISTKIIENEASKLGLTVTDKEMQDVLTQGTNPMLLQTPFVNQETQRFDVNQLKKFLAERSKAQANPQMAQQYETIYKYWNFIEKTLRQNLLAQKYQTLLAGCILSNPVEAAAYANESAQEKNIEVATFAYTDIKDDEVKPTDAELQAKYDEMKPVFAQQVETRDAKYIEVTVSASSTDRAAIQKEFAAYKTDLEAADAAKVGDVVRKSTSLVPYLGLPVKKEALPYFLAQKIDSISGTSTVFEDKASNTLNVVRVLGKTTQCDSVQYCMIACPGDTKAKRDALADSIVTAMNNGGNFAAIAKKYNQTGDSVWVSTAQYQNSPSISADDKAFITHLFNGAQGGFEKKQFGENTFVVKILNQKAPVEKYDVAVISKTIEFSRDTRTLAFNNFSQFISANQSLESIQKNAKAKGYTVQDAKNVVTSGHTFANIRSTREVLKWLFEAKEGDVSQMFECGDNDKLLVVVLEKINKKGFAGLDNQSVKDYVSQFVIKDKKAAKLIEKAAKCKDIAAAVQAGAKNDTISQITFSSPVSVKGASEPALAGAVAATKVNAFSKAPVKGENGVYVFKVTAENTVADKKKDVKEAEKTVRQRNMQYVGMFMQELMKNANITDNRYLFF